MNPGVKFHRFLTKQKEKVKNTCKSPDALITVVWGCSWMWKACPSRTCPRSGPPQGHSDTEKHTLIRLLLKVFCRTHPWRQLNKSYLHCPHFHTQLWQQETELVSRQQPQCEGHFFFLNFKSLDFWNNFYLSSDVFKVTETRGLCKGFHGRPAL